MKCPWHSVDYCLYFHIHLYHLFEASQQPCKIHIIKFILQMRELTFKEVEKTQHQTANCEARIWIPNFFSTPYSDTYEGKDKKQPGFLAPKMGGSYWIGRKKIKQLFFLRRLQNNFIYSALHSTAPFEENIECWCVPPRISGENISPLYVIRALQKAPDYPESGLCRKTDIRLKNSTLGDNHKGDQYET